MMLMRPGDAVEEGEVVVVVEGVEGVEGVEPVDPVEPVEAAAEEVQFAGFVRLQHLKSPKLLQ